VTQRDLDAARCSPRRSIEDHLPESISQIPSRITEPTSGSSLVGPAGAGSQQARLLRAAIPGRAFCAPGSD